MRVSPYLVLLAACSTTPAADEELFAPGLNKYEHVFHGVPSNGSLPDLGKADGQYPVKSTELLQWQSPVKDQNRRGVCTIFTTTGLMEHLYIKAGAMNPSFSEQYLQWAVKVEAGVLPNAEGSNIADNVGAINQFGIVTEAADPYNGTEWTAANDPACTPDGSETQQLPSKCWTQGDPPAAAQMGTKFFLPAGQFLNTTDIKAHITGDHTAVAVGIDFFYQAWNHGLSKLPINRADLKAGIVRYPNADDISSSHTQRAGHGILIVGWDDDVQFQAVDKDDKPMVDANGGPVMQKGFYIFKNSWGTNIFGVTHSAGAGYGYISEKYIEDFGTAYTTGLPDNINGTDPNNPPPPPPPPPSCQYNCSDYGFTANQCYMGWQCDAQGQCLSATASGGC
jgi:C1A family cysteine protease